MAPNMQFFPLTKLGDPSQKNSIYKQENALDCVFALKNQPSPLSMVKYFIQMERKKENNNYSKT